MSKRTMSTSTAVNTGEGWDMTLDDVQKLHRL
jgi:hypothetical protein